MKIDNAPICSYCQVTTRLVNSKLVYGQDRGLIYHCDQCGAYVGCHPGTHQAMGTPANASLRKLRMNLHAKLDGIWKKRVEAGLNGTGKDAFRGKHYERTVAYRELSRKLNIPMHQCHIGMFDEITCMKALEVLATCGKS